jgi:hypothetical protein
MAIRYLKTAHTRIEHPLVRWSQSHFHSWKVLVSILILIDIPPTSGEVTFLEMYSRL